MNQKTLSFVPWYNLENQRCIINETKNYPNHHLWGFDALNDAISLDKASGFFARLQKIIGVECLTQQVWAIFNQGKFDKIYLPTVTSGIWLAFFRLVGVLRRPIYGISHHSLSHHPNNIIKRIISKAKKWILCNGIDHLVFLNENILNISGTSGSGRNSGCAFLNWGVDYEYYDKLNYWHSGQKSYFYCTGKTNRDFSVIIDAFKVLESRLVIQTNGITKDVKLPRNVEVDNRHNLTDKDLIASYASAIAVLAPLIRQEDFPTGITVIFEAFCFSKPIIATRNNHFPIDIEKEGVGILIEYGDTQGWINAIQWMIDHPEEAKQMGVRGRDLVVSRYNYSRFKEELIEFLSSR